MYLDDNIVDAICTFNNAEASCVVQDFNANIPPNRTCILDRCRSCVHKHFFFSCPADSWSSWIPKENDFSDVSNRSDEKIRREVLFVRFGRETQI